LDTPLNGYRLQVADHYQKGQYEEQIQILRNKLGSVNFSHEYCSASLIIRNFTSGAGEMILPNTSGYDEALKLANLSRLFRTIESFCDIYLNRGDG
jgi:hypothetical protein